MKPLRNDEIYSLNDLAKWCKDAKESDNPKPVTRSKVLQYLRDLNVPLTHFGTYVAIPGHLINRALTEQAAGLNEDPDIDNSA